MYAQDGKEEDVRNIYQRASMVFVPISRPGIRLQYAVFEESQNRPDMARSVYESVLELRMFS
jgi:pre-mRNA-processing factor 39